METKQTSRSTCAVTLSGLLSTEGHPAACSAPTRRCRWIQLRAQKMKLLTSRSLVVCLRSLFSFLGCLRTPSGAVRKNRPTLEKKTHFPVFPFHLIDFCSRFLSKSKPLNIIYCIIAAKWLLLRRRTLRRSTSNSSSNAIALKDESVMRRKATREHINQGIVL